jgi:hypothetical protein
MRGLACLTALGPEGSVASSTPILQIPPAAVVRSYDNFRATDEQNHPVSIRRRNPRGGARTWKLSLAPVAIALLPFDLFQDFASGSERMAAQVRRFDSAVLR